VIMLGILLWNGTIIRLLSAISVSHVEAFGVKIDFDRERDALVQRIVDNPGPGLKADADFLKRAIERARLNIGAIRGRRILWIDDHPENNSLYVDLLSRMGITVVAVTSDDVARGLLSASPFDLIVTDGHRDDDKLETKGAPLTLCPVRFRALPDTSSATDLKSYQDRIDGGIGVPGGYRTVEMIAASGAVTGGSATSSDSAPLFADYQAPRIVMFSGSNGGIASDPCIRTITNRADLLFNTILSILEEDNDAVFPSTWEPKADKL